MTYALALENHRFKGFKGCVGLLRELGNKKWREPLFSAAYLDKVGNEGGGGAREECSSFHG